MTASVLSRLLANLKTATDNPKFFWFTVGLVFALAIFLRSYGWYNYPFGFDQVQILENAERITQGDITLIGPRTGPAPMFTGPLIYYLTAALLVVIPAPYTLIAVSLLISVLTGAVLLWLMYRFRSPTFALTLVTLWALAPLIVALDRVPWNPNLTILAATLSFLPLLEIAQTKKVSPILYLCLAAGTFLGYQAHFSGFLLPGLVIVSVLAMRPLRWLVGMAALAGLAVSLIPTLLFDLRNNGLNLQGFLSVVSGNTDGPSRWDSLVVSTLTVLSNWGRIFVAEFPQVLVILIGLVGVASLVYFYQSRRKTSEASTAWLPLLWLAATTLSLSFYRGNKPEYYFLLLMPVYLWWTTYLIMTVFKKPVIRTLILIFLMSYSLITVVMKNNQSQGMNVGNQLAVRDTISSKMSLGKVKQVVYDMEDVHSLGLRYLVKENNLQPTGELVHVMYPYQQGDLKTTHFSDVGVWIDPRTDVNRWYLTQPTYIVSVPKSLRILQDHFGAAQYQGNDLYALFEDTRQVGEVVVYQREWDTMAFDRLTDAFEKTARQGEWMPFAYQELKGYAYWSGPYFLVLTPDNHLRSDLKSLANTIVLIY